VNWSARRTSRSRGGNLVGLSPGALQVADRFLRQLREVDGLPEEADAAAVAPRQWDLPAAQRAAAGG
jgi:hypothetical protein